MRNYSLLSVLFALLILSSCSEPEMEVVHKTSEEIVRDSSMSLSSVLGPLEKKMSEQTGVYLLEEGQEAMLTRAWLCEYAEKTIDIQYFLFAADNIGLIATDFILRAANRGVKVRILVDDLLVDAGPKELLAINYHPNIDIKIYNPNSNIGKNLVGKLYSAATQFNSFNQRMHNKTFTVDGKVVITGGRNIADEYFDYDHRYNFRDRDVLLVGQTVGKVQESFQKFWDHTTATLVSQVISIDDYQVDTAQVFKFLHEYACDPVNFDSDIKVLLKDVPAAWENGVEEKLTWLDQVNFVSDVPGKNDGEEGLEGGGVTTDTLIALLQQAKIEVIIHSPYLITTKGSRALFAAVVNKGIKVKILTNSLASIDNLEAFSGYQRDREELLATGIEVYEFKPDAQVQMEVMNQDIHKDSTNIPIFGIHSKTMVIDGKVSVVGTFNLDPRSTNLNTECLTIMRSSELSKELRKTLLIDMEPQNAWKVTVNQNPDSTCSKWRQWKVKCRGVIPKSIL
jgi:putative cardiolipin synthase